MHYEFVTKWLYIEVNKVRHASYEMPQVKKPGN